MIERDLDEVLRSQRAMLERLEKTAASESSLRSAYVRYLEAARAWLDRHASTLVLRHRDVLRAPLEAAEALHAHFDLDGSPSRTAAVIDPSLHRHRSTDG